jgi:hypothetical protein
MNGMRHDLATGDRAAETEPQERAEAPLAPLMASILETERELRQALDRVLFCLRGPDRPTEEDRARHYGTLMALRAGLRSVRTLHTGRARSRHREISTPGASADDKDRN